MFVIIILVHISWNIKINLTNPTIDELLIYFVWVKYYLKFPCELLFTGNWIITKTLMDFGEIGSTIFSIVGSLFLVCLAVLLGIKIKYFLSFKTWIFINAKQFTYEHIWFDLITSIFTSRIRCLVSVVMCAKYHLTLIPFFFYSYEICRLVFCLEVFPLTFSPGSRTFGSNQRRFTITKQQ